MTHYDDIAAQVRALQVKCPYCAAEVGHQCVNWHTGVALKASHWQRISAPQEPVSESEISPQIS